MIDVSGELPHLRDLHLELINVHSKTPLFHFPISLPKDPRLSLSSPEFVTYSCSSPMQEFYDPVNEVTWHYRQGGNSDSEEAVVIFPTIAETTNSMFFIAPSLIKAGHRVVVVSVPPCDKMLSFLNGFDLFTAKMQIAEVHLIGFGFGGFLCLHLCSFKQLSAKVLSLILVCSYMNTQAFGKGSGVFPKTGKSQLADEFSIDRIPANLRPSVEFVLSEVERLPPSVAASRIAMRSSAPQAPVPDMPENSILMIHCLDWSIDLGENSLPQAMIKSQKVALMKTGGLLPHIAAPDKLMMYINLHLSKVGKSGQ